MFEKNRTKYRVLFDLYCGGADVFDRITFEVYVFDHHEARKLATDKMRILDLPVKDIFVEWD